MAMLTAVSVDCAALKLQAEETKVLVATNYQMRGLVGFLIATYRYASYEELYSQQPSIVIDYE